MRRSAGVLIVVALGCGKKSEAPSDKPKDKAPSGPPKIAITPVGKSKGSVVQELISTAADTLSSADGRLTIEIPSGALATAETLSIQTISNEAPGGIGTAYRLGPEGTTFTTPVKLTFNYSAKDLRGTVASALKVAYQGKKGSWHAMKKVTRDESAKVISVETLHFSDWSLVSGFLLRPPSGLLHANEGVELSVSYCEEELTDDELSPLTHQLYECSAASSKGSNIDLGEEWTVNAIENGNSSVGTITSKQGFNSIYTAPSIAPKSGNPVAVSVSLVDSATRRKTMLTSSFAVELKPDLKGTITSTQTDADGRTITTSAEVTFNWDDSMHWYAPAGSSSFLKVELDAVSGSCKVHGEAKHTQISGIDGHILVTEVGYLGSGNASVVVTGKQSCGTRTEPFSLPLDVKWWPAPIGRGFSLFAVKPDGSIEDAFTGSVNEATGEKFDAAWSLIPQTP